MSEELVSYEVRDRIAHVTISNGKANALSPDVLAALDAALSRAEDAGDEVGCMLLTGSGGMLSGGFDLKVIKSSPEAAGRMVTDGGALFSRMYGSEVPMVVACNGHAVAAGALLMMGADFRVGVEGNFRIGLIETEIGMVLPRWAIELSQERLARAYFQQSTVGARMYDPATAAAAGFLDAVVPVGELASVALAEAQRWAALPRAAYRGQVRMIRGERLGRLAEAIAADRGAAFDTV